MRSGTFGSSLEIGQNEPGSRSHDAQPENGLANNTAREQRINVR